MHDCLGAHADDCRGNGEDSATVYLKCLLKMLWVMLYSVLWIQAINTIRNCGSLLVSVKAKEFKDAIKKKEKQEKQQGISDVKATKSTKSD